MKKKTPLDLELDKARKSGMYMVSIWYREETELKQFRLTESFAVKDIPLALDLLQKDLAAISTPASPQRKTIQPPRQPVEKK